MSVSGVSSSAMLFAPPPSASGPSASPVVERAEEPAVKLSGLAAKLDAEAKPGPSTEPAGSCGSLVNVCC